MGGKAKGRYIMFVHQDIDLKSNEWLKKTKDMLNSLNELEIASVVEVFEIKGEI